MSGDSVSQTMSQADRIAALQRHPVVAHLLNYAQNDGQKSWMLSEMMKSPIRNGQTPEAWLLWRSKVSEGMSEVDAWRWVEQERSNVQQAQVQPQVQVQPQSQPRHQAMTSPMAHTQSISPVQHHQQLQSYPQYSGYSNQQPQHMMLRQAAPLPQDTSIQRLSPHPSASPTTNTTHLAPQQHLYHPHQQQQQQQAYFLQHARQHAPLVQGSGLGALQYASPPQPHVQTVHQAPQMSQQQLQMQQQMHPQNFVHMNDILHPQSTSQSFAVHNIAGPSSAGLASGSDNSSQGSTSSSRESSPDKEVDELEEDIKPDITPLPTSSLNMSRTSSTSSSQSRPSFRAYKAFALDQPNFNRPHPYPSWSESPFAKDLSLADSARRQKDSSSMDPKAPKTLKQPGASPSKGKQPQHSVPPIATVKTEAKPVFGVVTPIGQSPPELAAVTMDVIRKLLLPEKLKAADSKPGPLWKFFRSREDKDGYELPPFFEPDPAQLREILIALKKDASFDYRKQVADSYRYSEQIGVWLKSINKDVEKWEVAIPPMFLFLAATDMPVNYIGHFKIARLCKLINEKAQAKQLEAKQQIENTFSAYEDWCKKKLLPGGRKKDLPPGYEDAPKKRKLEDSAQEVKPAANGTGDAKDEKKPLASAAGSNKASSSYIPRATSSSSSALPPNKRPKLPDIKKREGPSVFASSPVTPVGTAASNLLASTLSRLKAPTNSNIPRNESPVNTQPVLNASGQPTVKLNKKGFAVKFRDVVGDIRPLVETKEFKEEEWELDTPWYQLDEDGVKIQHGTSAHQLDINEGATLRSQMNEHRDKAATEVIEWYEPDLYAEIELPPLTAEAQIQSIRERGILSSADGREGDDAIVRIVDNIPTQRFLPPAELQSQTISASTAAPAIAATNNISDLLKNLGNLQNLVPSAVPPPAAVHNAYSQQPQSYPGYPPQPAGQPYGYGSGDQYGTTRTYGYERDPPSDPYGSNNAWDSNGRGGGVGSAWGSGGDRGSGNRGRGGPRWKKR